MKPAFYFVAFLWLCSCSLNHITPQPINPAANLAGTTAISGSVMKNMEGIYTFNDGNNNLGTQFVCKTSRYKVSFFSNNNGLFFILNYGMNPTDSSIQFAGFWRFSENATQGLISFSVAKDAGASELLKYGDPSNMNLQGAFNDKNGKESISIKFKQAFSAYAKANEFIVLAHHGVQTTAGPPYAENSVGGVLHDEEYGCNGIEFDVRLTKDNVPICLHDNAINVRLTQKGPLSGEPSQYPFELLDQFITLVDGQKIPSVEQVINAFVDSTSMKYIWFDIKGDPGIFKYMEPVIRAGYARAQAQSRNVIIFTGLPSDDIIAEFHTQPSYSTLPTLCELTVQNVIDTHSQFWGPRYSRGLLLDEVDQMHQLGVKVISWTLNDKGIIRNYLENGRFDGFISDYPAFVVYDYYTMY